MADSSGEREPTLRSPRYFGGRWPAGSAHSGLYLLWLGGLEISSLISSPACCRPRAWQVFESELRIIDDRPTLTFALSSYTLQTEEAERISVDQAGDICSDPILPISDYAVHSFPDSWCFFASSSSPLLSSSPPPFLLSSSHLRSALTDAALVSMYRRSQLACASDCCGNNRCHTSFRPGRAGPRPPCPPTSAPSTGSLPPATRGGFSVGLVKQQCGDARPWRALGGSAMEMLQKRVRCIVAVLVAMQQGQVQPPPPFPIQQLQGQ